MKKKILAGIAILSFALVATLNSYGLHDLTHAGDPQGDGGTSTCSATSYGYTYSCDGSTLDCCEFNVDGLDYNCDGVYKEERN